MKVVVGLGNPGRKYKNTRHNLGYMAIDEIISNFKRQNSKQIQGLKLKTGAKIKAQIAELKVNGEKVLLVKPLTYMNESGRAIKALITNYQLLITNFIVIHDDVDLPLGRVKIKSGGGAAGHRGVESIFKELGEKNFVRIRLGIGPIKGDLESFVLSPFSEEEKEKIELMLKKTSKVLFFLIKEGAEKAMNKFN